MILCYAEGLKDNVNKDEDKKNFYCSVIIDEAEKMDKLVKALLNLSQFESGFYCLERTAFNLSALLDDTRIKYQSILREKEITLHVEEPAVLPVYANILRIEQLLVNFLNNDIDHADYEKILNISVEPAKSTNKTRINVFDTGRYIPEESLGHLWLTFYKVDNSRTRELAAMA